MYVLLVGLGGNRDVTENSVTGFVIYEVCLAKLETIYIYSLSGCNRKIKYVDII
jgi:hypothetical protein